MNEGLNSVLYWITGLAGAGKTTIGNELYYALRSQYDNVIILDGDSLKSVFLPRISGAESDFYSEENRHARAWQYAHLCKLLTDQGFIVICCTIAMYDDVREWNRGNNKAYVEVFIDVPLEVLIKRDQRGIYSAYYNGNKTNVAGLDIEVQIPKNPDVILKNDGSISIKECVNRVLDYKVEYRNDFKRDTKYWNSYYNSKMDTISPSPFAIWVNESIPAGTSILEIGCGNGRDSRYFYECGFDVTAVDAADEIIGRLREEYRGKDGIRFICDDFVSATTLYMKQYNYCYSRFSIHAISEEQEDDLLKNVYAAIKKGGKFFIEVRSVNDELYGKGEELARNTFLYDNHFRRFIVIDELTEKLKKFGFEIEYSEESRGFAPYQGQDPMVIRIVAIK